MDVREWSGGPPGCLEVVGRPSRMFESGRLALPDVREWSGVSSGCPGVVSWPSRISGSDRDALPDVRQLSGGPLDFREWSGDFPGCPVVVGWLSRMFGSGLKSLQNVRWPLPDFWEWSVGPLECPGDVESPIRTSRSGGRPSWMSSSCRESLLDVRELSVNSPVCLGVVGRNFQMFESGRLALPDVR